MFPLPFPFPLPLLTTTTTTTTTVPPAPPPTPVPAAATASAPAPSDPGVVPPVGQASAWGCAAALAYLQTYAAQGFALECPGYAEGREAMTCMNRTGACPGTSVIAIADPCPQAYMNEASNSYVITGSGRHADRPLWALPLTCNSYVITGVADTPIDPFGPCP